MSLFGFFMLLVLAYLLGSIPTAYIVARWARGIDIRKYGSGTVSGSMVYEHVHHWLVVPVGVFDVTKAAFPAWLALQLGYCDAGAAVVGIAAMIGHNWPLFLNFTGGRGISTIIGTLLVLFPWGVVWLAGFLAMGYLLGDSAPWALAAIASTPLLIWFCKGPAVLYWLAGAIMILTLVKRLEANRRPLPPPGLARKRVIWLRLVHDRDIAEHSSWIKRRL